MSINRQLLIAVNSILIVVASVLLLFDYHYQFGRQVHQKQIALTEEAKTIYESLLALETDGVNGLQGLVDNICARMNAEDSPGHHIAADWRGREIQAVSHGHASPDMFAAMRAASEAETGGANMTDSIVVGSFAGRAGTVFVSETESSVVAEARQSLIMHVAGGIGLAVVAAFIVNVVLQRVISSPMHGLVNALCDVADGNLSVIAEAGSCKELTYLADQINVMTRSLESAEKDRRFHMEKAREVQQHLLPAENEWPGLRVASLFEPAEDVGGDYFDVLSLSDHKYLICIADVTGHGVPAAMAAAIIKTLVQQAIEVSHRPADVLHHVNRGYTRIILPGHLATMVVIVIDARHLTITYANAGHEPPLLQLRSGKIRSLETADLLLGVDEDASYCEERLDVPSGAKVALLSDGVTEAFDPGGNQFGIERVLESMNGGNGLSATEIVHRLSADLNSFRRARPAFDDTTLVVAELLGDAFESSPVAHPNAGSANNRKGKDGEGGAPQSRG